MYMQQDGNRNKKESKRGCRQSTAFGEIDVKGSEAPNRRLDASLTRRRLLRGAAAAGTISALSGPAGAQQGPPQSGRFIIGTKSQAAVDAAKSRAESVRHTLDFGNVGQAVAGRFPEQARQALQKRNDVRYIEEDGEVNLHQQTRPWGIDRVDAEKVNDTRTGSGADIAIIDTGIDSDHPDLQANLGKGKAIIECSGSNCSEPWDDDASHGTHCAGIADAVDNTEGVIGVSTEATLHAVKTIDSSENGLQSDTAAGIEWTTDQGYDVASISLGWYDYSQTHADACLYAYDNGVVVVASAGNDGCSDCVNYPAKYTTVIAVSSTNSNDSLSSFSSYGPEVELAAPGSSIYSTVPGGYGYKSGTSMACPHVSGAAAQLMAQGYTNEEARKQLRRTAENIGLSDAKQGSGLLDDEAAVSSALGEAGTVSVDQAGTSEWHTVTLDSTYTDPAVIMKPVSHNGGNPSHVRLRDVDGGDSNQQFEFKIEEWKYDDGGHINETLHYVVMERGYHTLADETDIVAGYVDGFNQTFNTATYGGSFVSKPVVLSQPQTYNGGQPIVSRQRNITSDDVEWRVQEEEALGWHADERIGGIVIEPGTTDLNKTKFEVGRTSDTVQHQWYQIDFEQSYNSPVFEADLQTFDGPDPAGLRYRNLTDNSVEVFVEEEQSADDETRHTSEEVGYMVFEAGTKVGATGSTTESGSGGISDTSG
jgi:subtilisin family serine protease